MRQWLAGAGARAVLAFLWVFHWLPLGLQAACGRALGSVLFRLARSRRRVCLRNLELCLPEVPAPERERMARRVFQWFTRSVLERGLLWYGSADRLRRIVHVEGAVAFADTHPGPVMWLVPHFMALDVAGAATQLFVKRRVASIYQKQSNPVFDAAVLRGRLRHGKAEVFARSETVRPLLRAVRDGAVFFNLPDMDFGGRDAVFVPFFGVPASTLMAPSRMARSLGMAVQPVVAEMLPGGQGYRVRFLEPWTDFPSDDPVADATRMNGWIEQQVRALPEQYFWVHKRFKTRPAGAPSLYA